MERKLAGRSQEILGVRKVGGPGLLVSHPIAVRLRMDGAPQLK
jgi:hypothetical protein